MTFLTLLGVSFGFAMPAAVFAKRTFDIGALGGGLAAFAGARWVIDMDYWVLDSETRRAVNAVQRSAMPSGRADVDRLALQRLATAARQQRGRRVLLPIFLLTV